MPPADPEPYPTIVEERAHNMPNRTYAVIPKSASLQDGFTNFSYQQLVKAINKMAWWLDQNVGKSVDLDTLAYVGASDLRYAFLYIAAIKTRHKVELNLSLLRASADQLAGAVSVTHEFPAISVEPSRFHKLPYSDCIIGAATPLAGTEYGKRKLYDFVHAFI